MGNLACNILFRMPARHVIHYSRSPALTNLMHRQVPAIIPKLLWLTLFTQMAEIIIYSWPNIDHQAAIQLIVCEVCMLTHTEAILYSVLWYVLVFFLLNTIPEERVAENETITWARENEISWSIVRDMQHKGSFGFRLSSSIFEKTRRKLGKVFTKY